jgi:hypothetical protein
MTSGKFYTYAYLRENGTPYYIGKGSGSRAIARRKRGINPPKDLSRVVYLKRNLSEEEAFKHERYMIFVFGRKDLGTGILHNRTDGGEGSSNPSPETRKKKSEAGKRRVQSKETREKVSRAHTGRKHTAESRRNMSEAHKGLKRSDSHRKNLSRALTGRVRSEEHCKNISRGRTGIKYSEEARNNISNALLGRELSESHKRNIGDARKGMKWWVNRHSQTTFSRDCPGEGWVRGMKWRG